MKERLTGAIILVALLVLLVPELLTGPSRSAQSANSSSTTDGAQLRSYTINLADDASARRAEVAAPTVETPQPGAPPVEQTAASTDADASATAVPESGSTNAEESGNADADEVNTPIEPPPAPRVEAPKQTEEALKRRAAEERAAADSATAPRSEAPKQAQEALKRRAAEERAAADRTAVPRVEAPPAVARVESAPKRVASAPDSRAGWAVQVGSFASRENAERLARQLKGKGFAASVSESSGKGKRLWRVRVGPEADRAAAVALGGRLRSAGQPGAVVPYP